MNGWGWEWLGESAAATNEARFCSLSFHLAASHELQLCASSHRTRDLQLAWDDKLVVESILHHFPYLRRCRFTQTVSADMGMSHQHNMGHLALKIPIIRIHPYADNQVSIMVMMRHSLTRIMAGIRAGRRLCLGGRQSIPRRNYS